MCYEALCYSTSHYDKANHVRRKLFKDILAWCVRELSAGKKKVVIWDCDYRTWRRPKQRKKVYEFTSEDIPDWVVKQAGKTVMA